MWNRWVSNPKVAGNFYPNVAVKIDLGKYRTLSNPLFLGENSLVQMLFCSGDQTADFWPLFLVAGALLHSVLQGAGAL